MRALTRSRLSLAFAGALCAATPAHALEAKQCLPMAEMNAALKAEGQRTMIIGDRIAAIGNTTNPGVTTNMIRNVNTVTANEDGDGYQLEGDRSRSEPSTNVCVGAKLTNIQLFDARKTKIPRAAYLGGDFDRTVNEVAAGGNRPMLVANTVFGSGSSKHLGLPIVVFGNVDEKVATITTKDPKSGTAQVLALMNQAEYTSVALALLAQ